MNRRLGIVAVTLVLLASAALLFYRLGAEPYQDYDEATYAEITSEAFTTHDFLTFSFLNVPFFNKPPLLFWSMDVSRLVMGNNAAADRFPSALSAFVLIGLMMIVVYGVTGSLYAAAFGGGVLLTTSAFIEPARQVRFDTLVSLLDVVALYAFSYALRDRRWFLAVGAAVGLAILAKGPLVLYAFAAMLAMAFIYKKWRWLRDPYFWGGTLLAIAIVVPWHIYESLQFGTRFWDTYLDDQVLDRVSQSLFTGPTNFEYLEYIFQFAFPWAVAFCGSLVAAPFLWRRMSLPVRALLVSAVAGVASVLLVCFVTKTKAISYLIPLYPFMAIAVALVVYEIGQLIRAPRQPEGSSEKGGKTWASAPERRLFRNCLPVVFLGASGICLALGLYLSIDNGFHINGYYRTEVALADQEYDIGTFLRTHGATNFYVYDTTTLGAVMFYSHLLHPLGIGEGSLLPNGSYVLFQTSELAQLQAAYPHTTFSILSGGSLLELALVWN